MSVDDVIEKIKETRPYIKGITTSGGECTLQKEFLIELFNEVHKMGLSCFVDSNGSIDFESEKELTDSLDMVMLDVKAFDNHFHHKLCSFDNSIVIKNLKYLLSIDKLYEVRTVCIPGYDEENRKTIEEVSKIIQDKCIYKIIKYRPFGVREKNIALLAEDELPTEIAEEYVSLAKSLGATKACVI